MADDPFWTIAADRLSVTVGINTRIWLCRRQGVQPVRIRVGVEHTRLLLREHGLLAVPNRPFWTPAGILQFDPVHRLVWGTHRVPIRLSDRRIWGIAVETRPQGGKGSARRTASSEACAANPALR